MISDDISFLLKVKCLKCSISNPTPKSSHSMFKYHVSASESALLE